MKRTIALLSTVALIVSGAAPSEARTGSRIRVEGDNFYNTLAVQSGSCKDAGRPSTGGFDLDVVAAPSAPLGSHAIRWIPTTEDFARGPIARVDDAARLSALSLYVYGVVESDAGVVFARYRPNGEAGTWTGLAAAPIPKGEQWRRIDAASVELEWIHYTDGREDDDAGKETLQTFVSERGPGTAAVGFGFGCDGKAVQMDAFRVATDTADRTYDFEGYRTTSKIAFGKTARSHKAIRYGKSVQLEVGARVTSGGRALPGTVLVNAKQSTRDRYVQIKKLSLGRDGKAATMYTPKRSTKVRGRFVARDAFGGSVSRVLKIVVRRAVGASVSDRTPRKGQRIVFRGKQRPGSKTKVLLQRRTGSGWTTVRRTTSSGSGKYQVATTASQVGKTTWRVVALGGPGLAKGTSKPIVTSTRAPSPPPPSSPPPSSPPPSSPPPDSGGGSGGENPPPPPSGPLRPQHG